MKSLTSIIHSCNDREAELVTRYYLIKQNGRSKRLKLFSMIKWEGVTDDRTAAQRLYNRAPDPAFCQLKKRLREDVLNLLLILGDSSDAENDFLDVEVQASKLILQGKMLISRGLVEDGLLLIQQAFKLSGEYEAFEIQAVAYEMIQAHQLSGESVREEMTLMKNQFDENVRKLHQLLELQVNSNVSKTTCEDQVHYESTGTDFLVAGSDSTRLKFQYSLRRMELCFDQGDFEMARKYAEGFLPYFHQEGQIIPVDQKRHYLYSLSRILLCTGNYNGSLLHATNALQLSGNNESLTGRVNDILFRNYFYLRQYDQALNSLKKLEKNKSETSLFKAYLEFQQKKHRDISRTLNKMPTSASRRTLNFYCRLLELQNICEMGDTDWFGYKLESLRKYLGKERINNTDDRVTVIFRLLQSLSKNGLKKDDLTLGEFTSLLGSKCASYAWDPMGYELIPVNLWIRSSRKGSPSAEA